MISLDKAPRVRVPVARHGSPLDPAGTPATEWSCPNGKMLENPVGSKNNPSGYINYRIDIAYAYIDIDRLTIGYISTYIYPYINQHSVLCM